MLKVVYVVEVEVPEPTGSAMDVAARAVMDAVRSQTNCVTRAWIAIDDAAEAAVTAVGGTTT